MLPTGVWTVDPQILKPLNCIPFFIFSTVLDTQWGSENLTNSVFKCLKFRTVFLLLCKNIQTLDFLSRLIMTLENRIEKVSGEKWFWENSLGRYVDTCVSESRTRMSDFCASRSSFRITEDSSCKARRRFWNLRLAIFISFSVRASSCRRASFTWKYANSC